MFDVRVERAGAGLFVLIPESDKGRVWMDENIVFEDWQVVMGGIAVEGQRVAEDIVYGGMIPAGLEVH